MTAEEWSKQLMELYGDAHPGPDLLKALLEYSFCRGVCQGIDDSKKVTREVFHPKPTLVKS